MSLSFDPEALRVLADLLNTTGLSEIELAEGDRKLRLARTIAPVNVPVPAAGPSAVAMTAEASPMVGVAYLAAEPGAAPYVSVGQSVEVGQTLLLIEAMKTFNQIKAPRAGVVSQILVAAGAPVEYDEPLLIIE